MDYIADIPATSKCWRDWLKEVLESQWVITVFPKHGQKIAQICRSGEIHLDGFWFFHGALCAEGMSPSPFIDHFNIFWLSFST